MLSLTESDNILIAEIPSVAISYVYPYTYFSQALHIENTDVISIKNNTITANYSSSEGSYDTIYLIHATSSNNTSISDNKIKFDGIYSIDDFVLEKIDC